MIDIVNFVFAFLIGLFLLCTAIHAACDESKAGYVTNETLITSIAVVVGGLYIMFIALKYILQVGAL